MRPRRLLGRRRRSSWALESSELKRRKQQLSAEFRAGAETLPLVPPIEPAPNHLDRTTRDWLRHQAEAEPYWFQRLELFPGYFSPGWDDPAKSKLPYYGLPEDLTGKRVLDIGCAEGFFSFEAERRGAREVIGIDSFPDSVRRFNIVKEARRSGTTAVLMNVYDLEPKRLGTFDLVLCYGVLYHLKHPQLALERILSVCTGTLLLQTHALDDPRFQDEPYARFYPYGMLSGTQGEHYDPTVFWFLNELCCVGMLDLVGFTEIEVLSRAPHPFVVKSHSSEVAPGVPPDQTQAPWC
jgi:tRNA (mo5U34)-methyltransferase